jgi:formylmethanofuran dehydrogenase subunit D
MAAEVDVTLVTMQDIFQDEAGKKSLYSDEYQKYSAQIILDKQDMARLNAKDGEKLLVKNEVGSVVVSAKASEDEAHPGIAFMIISPWANQLAGETICISESDNAKSNNLESSISGFKGIRATVAPAGENAGITTITELFSRMKG